MLNINGITNTSNTLFTKDNPLVSKEERQVGMLLNITTNEISEIEKGLVQLKKLSNVLDLIKYQELDNITISMIDDMIGLESINLSIADFKGLNIEGRTEIATEGLIQSIINGMIAIWNYILKMLANVWNFIRDFFGEANKKNTQKMMYTLEKAIGVSENDSFIERHVPLRDIPDKEQIKIRFGFYDDIMKKIIDGRNQILNGVPFNSVEYLESAQRILRINDPKRLSGIVINTHAHSLNITAVKVVAAGTINQYNWLVDQTDGLIALQKKVLSLYDFFNVADFKNSMDTLCREKIKALKIGTTSVDDAENIYLENTKIVCILFIGICKAFMSDATIINKLAFQILKNGHKK